MAEEIVIETVEETYGPTVIGVSFGNANSSIAFTTKDGKVEVIANQDGDRSIPSVLSYVGEDEFHGFEAKAQLIRNSGNTVANYRDFIGKAFAEIDPTYSSGSAHPVEKDGKVAYKLVVSSAEDAEAEVVTVDEIARRHLVRLRESAADFLGRAITGAVLAVPTDFKPAQRGALKAIAEEAGLNVLQIINEPVAALLAHDAGAGATPDRVVAVADFGYSRSDGAVIAVRGGMYTVLATAHDYELGGATLDKVLVDHFAKEFEKKYSIDPRTDSKRSLAKLEAAAEVARKTLSASTSATVSIESLAGGFDFHSTVNRLRYETLARKALDSVVAFVEGLVKKAELDVLDIDEVVLVGGLSHTPKIASRLESLFDEHTTVAAPGSNPKALNPAELIARGTAFQASLIAGYEQADIDESTQAVVTNAPHLAAPLGVALADGTFVPLLERYTAVPVRRSVQFAAPQEGGNVFVAVAEGEEEIVVRTVERPTDEEDEEDEPFSDEEPEEVREKVVRAGKVVADAVLKDVPAGAQVEVIVNITAEKKVDVAVRAVGGGAAPVRGEV
ncbi:heat shock protein 70 family [Limtongia smithiae]|uniref:heat shock protein 70 family n=1 Tax=Limtongia smithiae TaxID=1125753 RepID=UPI0034CD779E